MSQGFHIAHSWKRVEDHLLTSGALNIWACKLLSSVLRSTRSIVPSVGRCLLRSAPNGQKSTTEPSCVLGFCFPDVGCHSPRLLTTPGDPVRLHAVYLINPFRRSATGSLRSICHDFNSCQMSKAAIRRRAMRRSPSRICTGGQRSRSCIKVTPRCLHERDRDDNVR